MAKKKLTPMQSEFKKQQIRIKNFIRGAEKRGFSFPDNIIPEMPKRVTKKALQEIKALKPVKLYPKATYTNKNTGYTFSGTVGRKIERKVAAAKGQRTRKRNLRWESEWYDYYIDDDYDQDDNFDDEYEDTQTEQSYDQSDLIEHLEYDEDTETVTPFSEEPEPDNHEYDDFDYSDYYDVDDYADEGKMILDNLEDLIKNTDTEGAEYLGNMLEYEIEKYGPNKVANALANVDDSIISEAENMIHYGGYSGGGASYNPRAVRNLAEAIKGEILKADEMTALNKIMSSMNGV